MLHKVLVNIESDTTGIEEIQAPHEEQSWNLTQAQQS